MEKTNQPNNIFLKFFNLKTPQDSESKPHKQNENTKGKIKRMEIINTIFTGLMAFFAYRTNQIYNDQLATQKIDQRAWVAPSKESFGPTSNHPKAIQIEIKNFGKTPAFNVVVYADGANNFSAIPQYDTEPTVATKSVVSPNATIYSVVAVTPTNIASIQSGQTNYIFGTIWYDDIFHRPHWTQFCFCPDQQLTSLGPPLNGIHCHTDDEQSQ